MEHHGYCGAKGGAARPSINVAMYDAGRHLLLPDMFKVDAVSYMLKYTYPHKTAIDILTRDMIISEHARVSVRKVISDPCAPSPA